jgi:hypothetical protein
MSNNGGPSIDWSPIIGHQVELFVDRFGREPRLGEPVFFDPLATGDRPEELRGERMMKALWQACAEVGLPGHMVHAIRVTGAAPGKPVPARFLAASLEGWRLHAKKGTGVCECG